MAARRLISSLTALVFFAANIVGQTNNAPRLSIVITSSRQQVQISWPATSENYVLEETAALNLTWEQTRNLPSTENGQFVLKVAPTNTSRFFRMKRVENVFNFRVVSHNPANGASEVGVTFRPQIFFSKPAHPGTLSTNSIYAMAGGRVLGANIVPASDGSFAWIFFKEPMPGATRVRVVVDGSLIAAQGGTPQLDGDGDGRPGGHFSYEFTTVSVADLSSTSLSGIVVDPGPDMVPRTADDLNAGPDARLGTSDDIFTIPIQGAKVFLLGRETNIITTGADGRFRFTSVPNGNVKIVVDGATALRPPPNGYFPEMVLDAQMILGKENWSMTNGPEIYLPRVSKNILQTVNSKTNTTVVKTTEEGAMGLSAFERSLLTVEVAPNSLVSSTGQVMTNGGQVGISTVPAEVVRDMLPPGVLQHTFDITVQAPGVATLAAPAPMTFPNVFNQPPGTKLNFLSFDHTTGRLVIEGTATVSDDGTYVRTDPGTGITHPGWHGLTPPGGPNDPPDGPPDPLCQEELLAADQEADVVASSASFSALALATDVPPAQTEGLQNYFFSDDDGEFTLVFRNTAARPATVSKDICGGTGPKPIVIRIQIFGNDNTKGKPNRFLEGIEKFVVRPFLLRPGQEKKIKVTLTPLLNEVKKVNSDRLYGCRLIIQGWEMGQPFTPLINRQIVIGRLLDAADANHTDGIMTMADTAIGANGQPGIVRKRTLESRGVPLFLRRADNALNPISVVANAVQFAPTLRGPLSVANLEVVAPGNVVIGNVRAEGSAKLQEFFVDGVKLRAAVAQLASGAVAGLTDDQRAFLNQSGAIDRIVARTIQDVDNLFDPFNQGIARTSAESAIGVAITAFSTAQGADPASVGPLILGRSDAIDICSLDGTVCLSSDRVVTPHPLLELVKLVPNISKSELAFRLSKALNQKPRGSFELYVDHFLTARRPENGLPYVVTEDKLVLEIVSTIVHEIGHTLGMIHTYNAKVARITKTCGCALGPNGKPLPEYLLDIMAHGETLQPRAFNISGPAFQVALGLDYTADEALRAIDYFSAGIRGAKKVGLEGFLQGFDGDDGNERYIFPKEPAFLQFLTDSDNPELKSNYEFGPVRVDGTGGVSSEAGLLLANDGDEPLTVSSVQLIGANPEYFKIAGLDGETVIAPYESIPIKVAFDPLKKGEASATLRIFGKGDEILSDFELTGSGFRTGPAIDVLVENNNVGGAPTAGTVIRNSFGVVTNCGTAELLIASITQKAADKTFEVTGLPAFNTANPLRIKPGEVLQFSVRFAPKTPGMQRDRLVFNSDDELEPAFEISVVGAGFAGGDSFLHYGEDFVAMESPDFPAAPVLRAKSDASGNFEFFLPPDQRYHLAIFDPVSGLIAHSLGFTAPSGRNTPIGVPVFLPSKAPDSDADGLPDDVEFAIGSNPNKADSDGNGLDDFVEVAQGRDPLGDQLAVTGLVGKVEMFSAGTVTLYSPVKETPNTLHAYVGDGSQLKVVDLSKPTLPVVLAATNAPGNVQDIAIDALTETAVVAAFRMALVNISQPASPQIVSTFDFEAVEVEALNGYGYAVKVAGNDPSASMRVIDLVSRTPLNSLPLPGRSIGNMVREANNLFLLGEETLIVVTVNGTNMTLRATLPMKGATGSMAVAGGILYVPFAAPDGSPITTGYSTVDVSNPDAPRVIAGPQAPANVARAPVMAVNGSGTGLMLGGSLEVMNVSNPTNTYSFITRFDLPRGGFGSAIEIGGGLGVVANSTGGLLIYNFAAADVKGQSPVIGNLQIQPDGDINASGLQLVEGHPFYVTANLQDDVQVRSVELLVDGIVVQRSISAPFVLSAIAPQLAQRTNIVVQLRATDTGGNSTLSAPMEVPIVFDPVTPVLVQLDPVEGELKGRGFNQARLIFSKPMGVSTAAAESYELRKSSGEKLPIRSGTLRDGDRVAEVNFDRLEAGNYRFIAHAGLIKDRAGNVLPGGDITRNFQVDSYSIRWVGPTNTQGLWFRATNWFPQRIPGPEDTVLIDSPANTPVVAVAPTEWQLAGLHYPVKVRALDCNEPFGMAWIDLEAEERVHVNSTFMAYASKMQNTRWIGGEGCTIYTISELILTGVTMEGEFRIDKTGYGFDEGGGRILEPFGAAFELHDSFTLNGNVRGILEPGAGNIARIRVPYTLAIQGSGSFSNISFFAAAKTKAGDPDPINEEITVGPGITFRGLQQIGVSGVRNRFINHGAILYDEPFSITNSSTRQSFYLEGFQTNSSEFINLGRFEVRNSAFLRINGTFRDRFINRGVLKVTERSFVQMNAYWSSPVTLCDADSTLDITGTFITEPGQVSLLSGPGRWIASRSSQLAGSTQVAASLLGGTNASPTNPGGQPIVRLTDGAVLEGSPSFNDITFEGELHNYDSNARRVDLPADIFGYNGDVVVRTNLTLNGAIFFHRYTNSIPGRLVWASGKDRLNGIGRIVFERASFPGQFGGSGTDLTIGPGITIEADSVAFGNQGRISQSFPVPYINNLGTILIEKPGSVVEFYAIGFTNSGTIKIGTGIIVTNFYAYTQGAAGSLILGAAGTDPGVSHGQLRNLGDVVLGGTLAVEATPQFQASAGSVLDLVTYRLTRTGEFATVVPPPAPAGNSWSSEYAANSFRLKLPSGGSTGGTNSGGGGTDQHGALLLNGGEQWGEVTHSAELSAYPLTAMAWIRTTDRGVEQRGIVSKWWDAVPIGYAIYLQDGKVHALYAKDFNFGVPGPGGAALDGDFVADGLWHHIAFVVDNLGGILYVDGVPKAEGGWNSATRQETGLAGPTVSNLPLFLGAIIIKNYGFKGELDEISLWKKALTPEEINRYKAQRLTSSDSDSIIGIWHFDEMSGEVAKDSSGHSHDASLKGGASFSTSPLP